jgi:neutral trehalase
MKLISTDFSNLGKKTIYDFGDDEAIDELLKDREATRREITREFFDDAEHLVRFQWMKNLAGMLLYSDSNAKKFFKAIEKEFQKYYKHREEMAKKGIIID